MSDVPSSMVDRVVLILGAFERSGGTLTLGQIAARCRLPRSSVHRILQQLVSARWIRRDDNEYTLGLRMFELGSLVVQRTRLCEVARPVMQELAAATGHAVHLAVLDEQDVVYLEKMTGPLAPPLPSRIGGRMPAHCTAVGKVLLAFSPRAFRESYLAEGLSRRTGASITSRQALAQSFTAIREHNYATERGEAAVGVACVAAPVMEFGVASAALSVSGTQERMRMQELKVRVQWSAAEISRRLAASFHARDQRAPEPVPLTGILTSAAGAGAAG
ncbi:IclR family transcriptional regulator [Streptomyces sp. NPDC056656]|uniref:IclR family transcriptional regulator n=1 Tax=Streptomyces sp. NPDC056656 TaxID=3345895 RepID=UPI0036B89F7B